MISNLIGDNDHMKKVEKKTWDYVDGF